MPDRPAPRLTFAVVSKEAPALVPYPYAFVTEAGTVHELDLQDRAYLEAEFSPMDGGRPYIKSSYETKDGWGSSQGFCARGAIPPGIAITAKPVLRGPPKPAAEFFRDFAEKRGHSFVQNSDGTLAIELQRPPKGTRWWQFWRRKA